MVGGENAAAVPRKDARINDEVFMVGQAFNSRRKSDQRMFPWRLLWRRRNSCDKIAGSIARLEVSAQLKLNHRGFARIEEGENDGPRYSALSVHHFFGIFAHLQSNLSLQFPTKMVPISLLPIFFHSTSFSAQPSKCSFIFLSSSLSISAV